MTSRARTTSCYDGTTFCSSSRSAPVPARAFRCNVALPRDYTVSTHCLSFHYTTSFATYAKSPLRTTLDCFWDAYSSSQRIHHFGSTYTSYFLSHHFRSASTCSFSSPHFRTPNLLHFRNCTVAICFFSTAFRTSTALTRQRIATPHSTNRHATRRKVAGRQSSIPPFTALEYTGTESCKWIRTSVRAVVDISDACHWCFCSSCARKHSLPASSGPARDSRTPTGDRGNEHGLSASVPVSSSTGAVATREAARNEVQVDSADWFASRGVSLHSSGVSARGQERGVESPRGRGSGLGGMAGGRGARSSNRTNSDTSPTSSPQSRVLEGEAEVGAFDQRAYIGK